MPFHARLLSIPGITAIAAAALFATSPAGAAPQILAVASQDLPVPLSCEAGECSAELTAFCLQEDRASPPAGTAYYLHDAHLLQLTITDTAGRRIDVSALPYRLTAARSHTAVKLSLRQVDLGDIDMAALHVRVPEQVSAIPVAAPGDTRPQTASDILLATASLRPLAARMVDDDAQRADAARLVNMAVNRLPARGRADPSRRDAAQAFFTTVSDRSGYSDSARELAAKAVTQCAYETQVGFRSFRQCLGSSHDQLIGKLNTRYWRSLNSGS
jgi:hypothetical protein